MAVNESLMSRVTKQHVVKYNKLKGPASLPFILPDTGVEAVNLNESHPTENRVKEMNLLCNSKKIKMHFFYAKLNRDYITSGLNVHTGSSQNYRITEWLRLAGTAGGHLVQPPC